MGFRFRMKERKGQIKDPVHGQVQVEHEIRFRSRSGSESVEGQGEYKDMCKDQGQVRDTVRLIVVSWFSSASRSGSW